MAVLLFAHITKRLSSKVLLTIPSFVHTSDSTTTMSFKSRLLERNKRKFNFASSLTYRGKTIASHGWMRCVIMCLLPFSFCDNALIRKHSITIQYIERRFCSTWKANWCCGKCHLWALSWSVRHNIRRLGRWWHTSAERLSNLSSAKCVLI